MWQKLSRQPGIELIIVKDTLGSVGVIISTILIQRFGWTGFDPIASLFIAALIIASVLPLVVDAGKVLALDIGSIDSKLHNALRDVSD
jgi:solute carrier family 30 (zinc transporter), member 5/7